ncbi:MAG: preprotein translocase subunit SecY [Gammaproteobacteria bacterium 39-13]|nr:preprotein translocase subunit SecY [Gammaproteobacteria bacterium]OJV92078.1 MAG: preprotein translocase subunit SecY [Gammaproteobacteria bacterium 39-13]
MTGGQRSSLGGLAELKQRLMFVLWGLIVFRIGAHIPVPGIDAARLAELFQNSQNNIIGMANVFSGGALTRLSIFALGIMPYISASIIMQLMTVISPQLEQLKKEGELGRRKISQYTRVGTLFLATFQAIGMAKFLASSGSALQLGFIFYLTTVVTLVTGTMFLMWLGEKITERGVGNGISLIIFAGIASGLPKAIGSTLDQVRQGGMSPIALIFLVMVLLAITAFVVFVERGQRRITVNYAKRQQGRKVYAAQQSHLPLKINMSGVIPPIFASSLILFPASISQWFGGSKSSWIADIGMALQPGQPLYILLFSSGIIFFCFFYTALVFNPRETADNLKRSGAFIPGIRPGEQTASYIDKVMTRLTLAGAVYITAVSILPEFLVLGWQVPFYFGGTSLLIIVVVIMDFIAQIQAHLMSQQYESLMKKANIKGRDGGPGGFGLLR